MARALDPETPGATETAATKTRRIFWRRQVHQPSTRDHSMSALSGYTCRHVRNSGWAVAHHLQGRASGAKAHSPALGADPFEELSLPGQVRLTEDGSARQERKPQPHQ